MLDSHSASHFYPNIRSEYYIYPNNIFLKEFSKYAVLNDPDLPNYFCPAYKNGTRSSNNISLVYEVVYTHSSHFDLHQRSTCRGSILIMHAIYLCALPNVLMK